MAIPDIKKVNTIGVTYEKGDVEDFHIRNIIENVLGIPESEVCGIDLRSSNRFIFKVSSSKRYEYICNNFTGRDHVLDRNLVIRFDDISSYGTRIEVSRVPYEVSNDILVQVFSKFGVVLKCQNYFRKIGGYDNLTHTGERLIWMNLKQQIPQSIYIKQINNFIKVTYENQPYSCNKCGHSDHNARACTIEQHNYKRVVDLNDIMVNKLDIHSEQLKHSELLKCDECAFECYYENILADHKAIHKDSDFLCSKCGFQTSILLDLENHMKEHTGETPTECDKHVQIPSKRLGVNDHRQSHNSKKQYKCEYCEWVNIGSDAHEKHMLSHRDEILLTCTECEYECINDDVLFNHYKNKHSLFMCKECDYKCKSEINLSKHTKMHNVNIIKCVLF